LYLSRLCWCLASGLALDHNVKVDKLVGKRAHVILEAKGVFPDCIGGENIVALALTLAIKEELFIGVLDLKVDVE
jgi:hypothetical protein